MAVFAGSLSMNKTVVAFLGLITFVALSEWATAAGPKLQVLHSFAGGTDGATPAANLVSDSIGNLYGTTAAGGSNKSCFGEIGCGTVFEVSPPQNVGGRWKESVLYRFAGGSDGAAPDSGLVLDGAGNLYGTTPYGGDLSNQLCVANTGDTGCGIVFEVSPQQGGGWVETVLYTFEGVTDGAYPEGDLAFDASGNLFGTTSAGGGGPECGSQLIGCGTVFELSPNGSGGWTETTVYQFQGQDGAIPLAGLIPDSLGNFYGTTFAGGTLGDGNVFELSPPQQQGESWTESSLYSFTAIAGNPRAGVIFDPQGNLYGTTSTGNGTVFELSQDGSTWNGTTIYSFKGGRFETLTGGLVRDNSGNLYGPASGPFCGAIYRLQEVNGQWKQAELVFPEKTEGPCGPTGALTFGKWGALYGTSTEGGTCSGSECGTVFGILP